MPDPNRRLPPVQTLIMFEAAARHLNFSQAARALGTTQPAVSHRIGALEADLGMVLFRRLRRGVALTPEGVRLFEAVAHGLDTIASATAALRAGQRPRRFNIATDFGFAAYWLMPRLPSLRAALPGRDVRIVTLQDEIDLGDEPVDAAIVCGSGRVRGAKVTPLFPEVVVPVCSPAFAADRPPVERAEDLRALPLLHLESAHPGRWLDWTEWFAAHSLPAAADGDGLAFNNYTMVVQAAVAGQGVALGWHPLIDELIRARHLVSLGLPVTTRRGYALVEPAARIPDPAAAAFRAWLTRQRQQGGGRPAPDG